MRKEMVVVVVLIFMGLSMAPLATLASPSGEPEPTYGPQDLYGHIVRGWGFTLNGETTPGPTITVAQFEPVTLNLFSSDTLTHTWLLDLDFSGMPSPGENESLGFSSSSTPLVFSFVPTAPQGIYQYICGIHGSIPMVGQFFITAPANMPPTASLTNPDGSPNRWTGGSLKRLTWTMNDPDGLASNLAVWLNYTSTAGSGPIASPATLPLGAVFYDWTLPLIDATDLRVHIEVEDPAGAKGSDANLVPIIDSTPPTVAGTDPSDGASGVGPGANISITFSESINTLGPGNVAILPPVGGLTLTWGFADTVLSVSHAAALQGATLYNVTVSDFVDTSGPGNVMAPFSFSFTTANSPPAIAVTQPTGTSRWSGGTAHGIAWTTTDAEDPSSALTVWVNYSATGMAPFSPIAGLQGVPGDTTTFLWTVPSDNTATARLAFTAVDTNDTSSTPQLSPAFAIDSTAPTVTGTNPTNGQTGVPLNANLFLTFSESMDPASTESAVTINPVAGTLGFTWSTPTELMVTHSASLAPFTNYTLNVSAVAHDISDPGNALGSVLTITFTTGAIADTTAPVLTDVTATPPTAPEGGAVEISANVTDNVAVNTVSVRVTQPNLSALNVTMSLGTGNRWAVTQTWTQVGTHTFVVWASDAAGNWASAGGSFQVTAVDATPPAITHTPHGAVDVGVAIEIHAMVTDEGSVQQVILVYMSVGGAEVNVTMTQSGGDNYTATIPGQTQAGTVHYRIYAIDDAGNDVLTSEFSITVREAAPPSNLLLYGGIALLVLLVVAAIAFLMLRRRRKRVPLEPSEKKEM